MNLKVIRNGFFGSCVVAAIGAVSFSTHAAEDSGACHYDDDARQSWKGLISRQLRAQDPDHSERLSIIASEIIDGDFVSFRRDIAGLNPNTSLKLAGGDMSLLDLSVAACQEAIAKELISMGGAADGDETSTPLVTAAAKGQDHLVEFLIQHGASVDKVDINGQTPLEAAVRQRQIGSVRMLLMHGSFPNRPISRGATVLDIVDHSADPIDRTISSELKLRGAINGLIK